MSVQRSQTSGVIVAIALSMLTLSVFGLQQNAGPQSTLNKFHQAVIRNSEPEIMSLIVQPMDANAARTLVLKLWSANQQGAQMRIGRTVIERRRAFVSVIYQYPNGLTEETVWVLNRSRGGWKVNPFETLALFQQRIGG